jgi:hypothetical protein
VGLAAKLSPTSDATNTIILSDVLHVPGYICDAIGQPIVIAHEVVFSKGDCTGGIYIKGGRQLAYTEPEHTLFSVVVLPPDGHQLGASAFRLGKHYMISCRWEEVEVRKWKLFKKRGADGVVFDGTRLYTQSERKLLKEEYGGEYKFLGQHGLSIHKDEDREEGRGILRAVMHERNGGGGW